MRKIMELTQVADGSRRRAGVLVAALAFMTIFAARLAFAQDEVVPDEQAKIEEAADARAPAPAAASAPDATNAPPPRQSYLGWLYDSLGLMYSIIFFFLSFSLVAVFVMNVLVARREHDLPSH